MALARSARLNPTSNATGRHPWAASSRNEVREPSAAMVSNRHQNEAWAISAPSAAGRRPAPPRAERGNRLTRACRGNQYTFEKERA